MTPFQTHLLSEIRNECKQGDVADVDLLYAELSIHRANGTGVASLEGLPLTWQAFQSDLAALAAQGDIEYAGGHCWRPVDREKAQKPAPRKPATLFSMEDV